MTKINGEFGSNGKASVNYGASGESLKIAVNAGVTAKLVAGPADFDALARLGIAAGTLSNDIFEQQLVLVEFAPRPPQPSGSASASNMDISTATDAGAARAQLLTVLSAIQNVYQTTNTPRIEQQRDDQRSRAEPRRPIFRPNWRIIRLASSMLTSAD